MKNVSCLSKQENEEPYLPHFNQSSPINFETVEEAKMIVRQIVTYQLCFIKAKFENPTDFVTWFVTGTSLQIPGLRISTSCMVVNANAGGTARRSTTS